MNLVLALDNQTSDDLSHLAPHKSMFNLNKARSLTSIARIPKPVASTIGNWLHMEEPISNDPSKRKFLEDLSI